MSGLFSQAILDMLAAEGTTPATKSLILDFLNAAQSVNDIAGIEPQEGPVVDDPARGFGDQVADYDIGAVVAQRIIARRTALGRSSMPRCRNRAADGGRDRRLSAELRG